MQNKKIKDVLPAKEIEVCFIDPYYLLSILNFGIERLNIHVGFPQLLIPLIIHCCRLMMNFF